MSLMGNIIWLVFGGFFAGLGYILGGLGLMSDHYRYSLLVFSLSSLASLHLTPFGKDVKVDQDCRWFLVCNF
jgi:uncharacterized membrane protein YccF (DUF307 family)